MRTFLERLTSRKFIAGLAGVLTGVALILGADADAVTKVTGALTTLISAVTYIVTEGSIDRQ